jgi:hypothetical protein
MLWLWSGCGDIPRDNLLDPMNPASTIRQTVMVEAFINTNNPSSINEIALQALDSLASIYHINILIAEYHRNTADYVDPYHMDKNEILYEDYVSRFDDIKGVPDIFINGTDRRVQGASTVSYSLFRLEQALAGEVSQHCDFMLDVDYSIENNKIIPDVLLARLGNEDARNIRVRAVLTGSLELPLHERVVRGMSESQWIPFLGHGETRPVGLPEIPVSEGMHTLIVYVTGEDDSIEQCAFCPVH